MKKIFSIFLMILIFVLPISAFADSTVPLPSDFPATDYYIVLESVEGNIYLILGNGTFNVSMSATNANMIVKTGVGTLYNSVYQLVDGAWVNVYPSTINYSNVKVALDGDKWVDNNSGYILNIGVSSTIDNYDFSIGGDPDNPDDPVNPDDPDNPDEPTYSEVDLTEVLNRLDTLIIINSSILIVTLFTYFISAIRKFGSKINRKGDL